MAKQTLKILPPTEVPDLGSLAKQIDAAHVAAQTALLTGVQKAVEAGLAVVDAKIGVGLALGVCSRPC